MLANSKTISTFSIARVALTELKIKLGRASRSFREFDLTGDYGKKMIIEMWQTSDKEGISLFLSSTIILLVLPAPGSACINSTIIFFVLYG